MKETFVADLKPDSPVRSTFLVQSKERKVASNGAAYLDLTLQDTTGAIGAKLWDFSERTTPPFEADDVVNIEGHVESYRGARQLKIRRITLCSPDAVDLLDYLPRSRRDPEEMFAALLERVGRMGEGPLRTLVLSIMEDPTLAAKYKLAPAAMELSSRFSGWIAGACFVSGRLG